MKTAGFHHVALVTADLSRSIAFYEELLGLPVAPGAGRVAVLGSGPGSLVMLSESRDGGRGFAGLGGVHHVAFGTSSEAVQLMWKRRLVDAGVAVSGPYDRGWFHSIYFRDPDGQVLEIATAGPGYARDEDPARLGEEVIMPGAGQIRGNRDERQIAGRTHDAPVHTISEDMRLHGIHHVTGFTSDVAETDLFYQRALGLRLVKRSVNQDDGRTPHWFWARYEDGHVAPHSSLTMFGSWSEGGAMARYHGMRSGIGQAHHVAFRATDSAELDAWESHLRSLSLEVARVSDSPYESIRFRAPDGMLFDIAV